MENILVKTRVTLFHGWAYIDGHWVYLPLWDPAPIDRRYRGFKQLQLASAIYDISKNVTSKEYVSKLNDIILDLINKSGKSALASYEEGDGICPDWWPFPKFPGGGGGNPDPDPIYFPAELDKRLVNQLAGHLLTNLASQVKMGQLTEIGNAIMNARG